MVLSTILSYAYAPIKCACAVRLLHVPPAVAAEAQRVGLAFAHCARRFLAQVVNGLAQRQDLDALADQERQIPSLVDPGLPCQQLLSLCDPRLRLLPPGRILGPQLVLAS